MKQPEMLRVLNSLLLSFAQYGCCLYNRTSMKKLCNGNIFTANIPVTMLHVCKFTVTHLKPADSTVDVRLEKAITIKREWDRTKRGSTLFCGKVSCAGFYSHGTYWNMSRENSKANNYIYRIPQRTQRAGHGSLFGLHSAAQYTYFGSLLGGWGKIHLNRKKSDVG